MPALVGVVLIALLVILSKMYYSDTTYLMFRRRVSLDTTWQNLAWRRAATQLRLKFERNPSGDVLTGQVNGFEVTVTSFDVQNRHDLETHTRIVVNDLGRFPPDLRLGKEGTLTSIRGRDLVTGDTDFDSRVRVSGPEAETLALLDEGTRQQISIEVGQNGVEAHDGVVRWDARDLDVKLVERGRGLVSLASRLALGKDPVPERLARNATGDSNAAVRVRNLEVLTENFGDSESACHACARLLQSEHPELRLLAGIHLGDAGFDAVGSVASSEQVPPETRITALRHLATDSSAVRSGPVLERVLASTLPEVRRVAIESIGQLCYRPALGRLIQLGDGRVGDRPLVSDALAKIGDVAAEPALIRWLDFEPVEVKITVVRALGLVGSIVAVEPLLACTKGLLTDHDLRSAAHEAIAAIQGRLGNVQEGRLSLSQLPQKEGALSLATEAGELSLPGEQQESPMWPSGGASPASKALENPGQAS